MIDREKLTSILDRLDAIDSIEKELTLTINPTSFEISIFPKGWWSGKIFDEDDRHKIVGALTPLVGKLEKETSDGNISYAGEFNGISVSISRADKCKILGYRKVKRTVKKEIEKPVEYQEVEEEVRIPITDCDIRSGKATKDQIEVPA